MNPSSVNHRLASPLASLTIVAWCVAMFATNAGADLLQLKTGGRVEGVLVNPNQSPRKEYVILLETGGEITIAADDVIRFVATSESQRRYAKLLQNENMEETADHHWRISKWCQTNSLPEERVKHLEVVIRLDPDHEPARRALGYSQLNGLWVKQADYMRERGYVMYEGRWMFSQDVEIAENRKKYALAVIEWNQNLKRWRGWYGRKKWAEGLLHIQQITDPLAAESLTKLLAEEDNPELQQLFIRVLGRLHTQLATKAFIRIVAGPANVEIRELVLDQLEDYGSELAIDAFVKLLKSNDNRVVRRAAVGLRRLPDERAIRPLIDALVTEHQVVVGNPSGQMSTSFGGSGSGGTGGIGFSAGGGPKMIKKSLNNSEVLDALLPLVDGANFQYNQLFWREWYTRQSTPADLDLRRAP